MKLDNHFIYISLLQADKRNMVGVIAVGIGAAVAAFLVCQIT